MTTLLHSQSLPAFKLALETECFLTFLSEFTFGAARRELVRGVAGLELINGLEKLLNLFAGASDVFLKLRVDLVTAVDL